jgi:hypothetical protein
MYRPFGLVALAALVCVPAARADINADVVKFCEEHKGRKVGDGQCTDLVAAACDRAGAKGLGRFKDRPNAGDYVWGELVYGLRVKDGARVEDGVVGKTVRPGDIVQFRDTRFKGRHGFWSYPHHTAVVSKVSADGKVLHVLHQNVGSGDMSDDERMKVKEGTLHLEELEDGWIKVYRPLPR